MFRLFLFSFVLFSATIDLKAQIPGLSQLIKKVDPSVVKVYTVNSRNAFESQGSGVIITSNGICVSNYHVLIGAKKAVVITSNGQKFDITKIIDYSRENDLVKFKIDIGNQTTPPVDMSESLPLKGANVFAVGYPHGFKIEGESTLSTGIISGIREKNGEKIIQTTTPFTHGSSGGGLFDTNGKLIGITSGTFSDDVKDRHANLNKVIPAVLVNKLSNNLNLSLESFYNKIKNDEYFIKGMLAYENLDFKTASEFFTGHLLDYPEDAIAWFRLGNCLHQLGRHRMNEEMLYTALNCFDLSISLDSNYYFTWGQAAVVNATLGNISQAKYYATVAYKIEPDNSFTNYAVGKVAAADRDWTTAVKFFGYAINKADSWDQANKMHQWYLERAISNAWAGNDYNAEHDYKKCLSLNAQNLDALFWYGNFLGRKNRYAEACAQWRKLKYLSPKYNMGGKSVDQMLQMGRCN
jgi:tetratricopeptide (TPR) repeat protein